MRHLLALACCLHSGLSRFLQITQKAPQAPNQTGLQQIFCITSVSKLRLNMWIKGKPADSYRGLCIYETCGPAKTFICIKLSEIILATDSSPHVVRAASIAVGKMETFAAECPYSSCSRWKQLCSDSDLLLKQSNSLRPQVLTLPEKHEVRKLFARQSTVWDLLHFIGSRRKCH